MARPISQAGVPNEVAALIPIGVPSLAGGQGIEEIGRTLTDLSVEMIQLDMVSSVATGIARNNDLFTEFKNSLANEQDPDKFLPSFEKHLIKRQKVFRGMPRAARDVLKNKFKVWDSIDRAEIARVVIAQKKDIALENMGIAAVSLARSNHPDKEESLEELFVNNPNVVPTTAQKNAFRAMFDRELTKHIESQGMNFIMSTARNIDTIANVVDYINTEGLRLGLPTATITWMRTAEVGRRALEADESFDEHTEAILKGDFSPARTDLIANDPRLKGFSSELRSLANWMTLRQNAAGQTEQSTPPERLGAELEFLEALDSNDTENAHELLMKNSWMFTGSENSDFLAQIRKPPDSVSDPTLKDAIAEVEAFADLERAAVAFDPDDIEKGLIPKEESQRVLKERTKILRKANELKQAIRQWRLENPKDSPGQFNQAIDDILNPFKQQQVADDVNRWWDAVRFMTGQFPEGHEPKVRPKPDIAAQADATRPQPPSNHDVFIKTLNNLPPDKAREYFNKWKHLYPKVYE